MSGNGSPSLRSFLEELHAKAADRDLLMIPNAPPRIVRELSATLTPTLSLAELAEGEGAIPIPSPPEGRGTGEGARAQDARRTFVNGAGRARSSIPGLPPAPPPSSSSTRPGLSADSAGATPCPPTLSGARRRCWTPARGRGDGERARERRVDEPLWPRSSSMSCSASAGRRRPGSRAARRAVHPDPRGKCQSTPRAPPRPRC
jgi:hypothetical protein